MARTCRRSPYRRRVEQPPSCNKPAGRRRSQDVEDQDEGGQAGISTATWKSWLDKIPHAIVDVASEVSGRRELVALWREALLAQKVLRGATKGYKHHPQLQRFSESAHPPAALASYLAAVHEEAVQRGYKFDASKIGAQRIRGKMTGTRGQLLYEWRHLKRKLKKRDPKRLRNLISVEIRAPHPLFRIVPGKVRDWEKVR